MATVRLRRNDPCWCGSGQKYKNCHLRCHEEKRLPREAIAAKFRTQFRAKRCLHPLAASETCGKIIGAHTIQRAGALRRVIDASNHVLTFYPLAFDEAGHPRIHRRGWREASTFFGFCDKHDGPTFAPLESEPFVASPEQCFLVAYRALCHELYQKHASVNSHPVICDLVDRGMPEESQRKVQDFFATIRAGAARGLANAEARKRLMDQALLAKEYSQWRSWIADFTGDITITSTGTQTPNVDLNGNVLHVLHDPDAELEYLHFAVLPLASGGAFVFTWLNSEEAPNRFVDSLAALSMDALPHFLAQFMLAYCENTYFSAAWWNSLESRMRDHLTRIATNPNPYYSGIQYRTENVVPWRVTRIEKR